MNCSRTPSRCLTKIIEEAAADEQTPRYGFWPAASARATTSFSIRTKRRSEELTPHPHALRQQWENAKDNATSAASPITSRRLTQGRKRLPRCVLLSRPASGGTNELCAKYARDHDDYNSIMVKALADRLAEAFAELLASKGPHQAILGLRIDANESLTREDMIAREVSSNSIRLTGYPACPDHTEKSQTIFDILRRGTGDRHCRSPKQRFPLPAASVSGLYYAHPAGSLLPRVDRINEGARRKSYAEQQRECRSPTSNAGSDLTSLTNPDAPWSARTPLHGPSRSFSPRWGNSAHVAPGELQRKCPDPCGM